MLTRLFKALVWVREYAAANWMPTRAGMTISR
jgi:hypothetical protein